MILGRCPKTSLKAFGCSLNHEYNDRPQPTEAVDRAPLSSFLSLGIESKAQGFKLLECYVVQGRGMQDSNPFIQAAECQRQMPEALQV